MIKLKIYFKKNDLELNNLLLHSDQKIKYSYNYSENIFLF